MKLVVLAGAKKGAAIPLKKDRFTIGRSKECSLRAGSDAISRKHCEITRTDKGLLVRDLGSRNGTYVNDERIEGKAPLGEGDRLRVGPLEFRFESGKKPEKAKEPKNVKAKKPAASRPKSTGGMEDNISDWLLGDMDSSQAVRETQSFHVDDTKAIVEELARAAEEAAEEDEPNEDPETVDVEPEENGKKKKKKKPGKLPKGLLDQGKTKDSREAAVQILRDMARRR